MTKMTAMPIYGKNHSKIFLTGTGGTISTKLGMYFWGLLPIIVYENNDLDPFYAKVKFRRFYRKMEKSRYFRNYCSRWPENL